MKTFIAIVVTAIITLPVVLAEPKVKWSEFKALDRTAEFQKALEKSEDDRATARQPVRLGYAAATYFASGSLDTPQVGKTQHLHMVFADSGDVENDAKTAVIDVTFIGYSPGHPNFGEQFRMTLARQAGMIWAISKVEHRVCARLPLEATKPKSGKFADFLKLAKEEAAANDPATITHEKFRQPLKLSIAHWDNFEPVDPLVIGVSAKEISIDEVVIKEADLLPRLKEYVEQVELVGEQPMVVIAGSSEASFERGIKALQLISNAGLKRVYMLRPPRSSPDPGPSGRPSTKKSTRIIRKKRPKK